jgi:hypothetical protein
MYVYRKTLGLGQDDSGGLFTPTVDLSSVNLGSVGFLTSPVFLSGLGLLAMAFLLSRGKRVVKSRRKRLSKRYAMKAKIKALQAGL